MRILITGGYGLLGSRFGKYLFGQNHEILLGTRKNPITSPEWLPGAEVITMKWDNYEFLRNICKDIDIIIYASGINAIDCEKNPYEALKVNGLYTANLISAAVKENVKKFVYLSTAHVYSSPLVGNINENLPMMNIHPYATSHLAGEHAIQYMHQKKNIPFTLPNWWLQKKFVKNKILFVLLIQKKGGSG